MVTARLAARAGVGARVLPMSDDPIRTMIRTPGGRLTFQEYFVREKALVEVVGVDYEGAAAATPAAGVVDAPSRSEEHTSELQSRSDLVCRLLLEKKKNTPSSQPPLATTHA